MEDCIFCKIVKGEIPCKKIYEDEYTLAFLDIAKDHYGHTLVIPKMHCKNILDCPKNILEKVILTVQKVSQHYVDNCGFGGVNILNANNEEAQQSVFHLHFHIIPRMNSQEIDAFPGKVEVKGSLEQMQDRLKLN